MLDGGEGIDHAAEQPRAFAGQLQLAGRADEKPAPRKPLEPRHALAQCRRADSKTLRGMSAAARQCRVPHGVCQRLCNSRISFLNMRLKIALTVTRLDPAGPPADNGFIGPVVGGFEHEP